MMFSVIIPVYNAEKYLRPCLDSVLNQTESDWECVCVDDGSTDASGMILDEYAARDSRFKVIHQANGGEGVARNTGLKMAVGDWITWLDADDLYRTDRLEEARRLIDRENPDLVRFRTCMGREGENQFPADMKDSYDYRVMTGSEAQKWGWQVLAPAGMVWTWVARRTLLEGRSFRPGMRVKVDSIFSASLANSLQKVLQSEYKAYFYRYIASSAIHCVRKADDCIRLLNAVRDLYLSPICSSPTLNPEVRRRMLCWLRVHAESDILDWIRMQRGERSRSHEILSCYHELKQIGVCDCPSLLRVFVRFPFGWWAHTGQLWMVEFIDYLLICFRNLTRKT